VAGPARQHLSVSTNVHELRDSRILEYRSYVMTSNRKSRPCGAFRNQADHGTATGAYGENQRDGRPGLAAPHRYPRYRLGFRKSPQRLSPFAPLYSQSAPATTPKCS
jgi:hypothetical protein